MKCENVFYYIFFLYILTYSLWSIYTEGIIGHGISSINRVLIIR